MLNAAGMHVTQILYSGLGGHGGVAFALTAGDSHGQWRPSMGFLGIEPLLPDYAALCKAEGFPFRYFPATPRKPWRSWGPLYDWLAESRPDAILLHSVSAVIPCAIHARRRGIPLVVVEHQQNALKTRGEWLASGAAMLLADRVVVLTQDYADALKAGLGKLFLEKKVTVIGNGVDTHLFTPGDHRSEGTARLGMAARFSASKRFDHLIDMMLVLGRKAPHVRWQLSLAGSGDRHEEVRREIEKSGLEGKVVLEGMLANRHLADWYRSLDLYVHATDGETLSLSILQAMASHVPVITSDAPGMGGLFDSDECLGILVPQPSGPAFADAVLKARENPDWLQAMAANALARVRGRHSLQAMFSNYASLLEVLKKAKPQFAPTRQRGTGGIARSADAPTPSAQSNVDRNVK